MTGDGGEDGSTVEHSPTAVGVEIIKLVLEIAGHVGLGCNTCFKGRYTTRARGFPASTLHVSASDVGVAKCAFCTEFGEGTRLGRAIRWRWHTGLVRNLGTRVGVDLSRGPLGIACAIERVRWRDVEPALIGRFCVALVFHHGGDSRTCSLRLRTR